MINIYSLSPEIASGYFAFDDGATFTKSTWESALYSASASYNASIDILNLKKILMRYVVHLDTMLQSHKQVDFATLIMQP